MLQRRRSRGPSRRHAEVRKNRSVGGCLPKSCELLGLLAIAKACTWFPQVLADLQSGDERDRGRNESLILGSLSEELQAQAYFHIYGSLLQTSALLCELGRAASKEFPVSCSNPNPLSQTTSSHTHHPLPPSACPTYAACNVEWQSKPNGAPITISSSHRCRRWPTHSWQWANHCAAHNRTCHVSSFSGGAQ